MNGLLLDTHVWSYTLQNDLASLGRMSEVIAVSEAVFVSPVSLYEIGWKASLGKWPAMGRFIPELDTYPARQGFEFAQVSPAVMLKAASLDWSHRDPFDRMLASTAESLDFTLVTKDEALRSFLPDRTLW